MSCLVTDLNLITVSEVPIKLTLLMVFGIRTFTAFSLIDEGVFGEFVGKEMYHKS